MATGTNTLFRPHSSSGSPPTPAADNRRSPTMTIADSHRRTRTLWLTRRSARSAVVALHMDLAEPAQAFLGRVVGFAVAAFPGHFGLGIDFYS